MELLKTEFVPGNPPVLRVDGEIDLATVDQLDAALEEALATDSRFVVDMAGVTFIDVVGLQAVLRVAVSRNGLGPLIVLNAPRVAWLLDLVGLSEMSSIVVREEGEAGVRGSHSPR
jgi:anti-anti-sigma factor